MSPRAWRDSITDILDAIDEIHEFTRGMSYDAFRHDDKTIACWDPSRGSGIALQPVFIHNLDLNTDTPAGIV